MSIKVRAIKDGYRFNRIIKPGMGAASEFLIDSFSEFSRGFKEPSKRGVGRKHSGWMEIIGISKDHKETDPAQAQALKAHMKAMKEAKPVVEEFTDADEFESIDEVAADNAPEAEIEDITSEDATDEDSSQDESGGDTIGDEEEI